MQRLGTWLCLAGLLSLAGIGTPVSAQEPPAGNQAEDPSRSFPPYDATTWALFATAQVGESTDPLFFLMLGKTEEVAFQWQGAASHLQPVVRKEINPRADLDRLNNIEDEFFWPEPGTNRWEFDSFKYLMGLARDVPTDLLSRHARTDINYSQLYTEPWKQRGQIIRIRGYLRMLNERTAQRELIDAGIQNYYEAWIYDPNNTYHYCVVLIEKPEGTALGRVEGKRYVEVDGYFFKKLKYATEEVVQGKGRAMNYAPMLIGHSLRFAKEPAQASDDGFGWVEPRTIVLVIGGLIGVPVTLAVVLGLWFRRGDRAFRERINAARPVQLILPENDGSPAIPEARPVAEENGGLDDLAARLAAQGGPPGQDAGPGPG